MKNTGYEEQLNKHFKPLVKEHGASHRSVNWGSQASQNLRFEMLLSYGPKPGESLLDLGCGVGHLYKYARDKYPDLEYQGVDLVADMVAQAKATFAEGRFDKLDMMEQGWQAKYDAVIASGIFYIGCDYDRMFAQIESMWKASKRVIAFNSLSSWAADQEDGEFYADPLKVLEFCRTLSNRVILRHDYMPHDFTIQVFAPEVN